MPKVCRVCGRTDKEAHISRRGFCLECGAARMKRAIEAAGGDGEGGYKRWEAAMRPFLEKFITKED